MSISVCIITYNHEKFIRQAIESILNQRCSYEIEIIIGEDCSTDKTRSICEEYKDQHPRKIKLYKRSKNLGMIPNFVKTLKACKGNYIAFCEGDDYWTDPYKLQKQVDFLEENKEFSICFHKVKLLENKELKEDNISNVPSQITTIKDLVSRPNYIHTPSCVFRNNLDKIPFTNIYTSPLGDLYLHVMNAQFGKIFYFPEPMAIYRIHSSSNWSSKDDKYKRLKGLKARKAILMDLSNQNNEAYYELLKRFIHSSTNIFFECTENEREIIIEDLSSFPIPVTRLLFENLLKVRELKNDSKSIRKLLKLLTTQIKSRIKSSFSLNSKSKNS